MAGEKSSRTVIPLVESAVREEKFFIVVPPAFERVAFYELMRKLKHLNLEERPVEFFTGGLELSLPMAVGLALNHVLKVPTRILIRVESREILAVKDYLDFIKSQDWRPYGKLRKVYASSRTSKLKIKGSLEEMFEKQSGATWSKTEGTDIYIRFFRDECTLSVDTSGEDLYQRGYEKWVGEAPLRDNMAAALLRFSLQGVEDVSQWEVLDPMCGSGTFLLEADHFNKMFSRTFAYEKWKFVKREEVQSAIKAMSEEKPGASVRGFERDPKTLETARRNLSELGLDPQQIQSADLFKDDSIVPSKGPRLVILNPPLGKRLKIGDRRLFQDIVDRIVTKFAPDRLGILIPEKIDLEHKDYESVRIHTFSNNGLYLRFFLFLKTEKP
jgi:putative N6-adenine-specific DNA methylase